MKTIYQPEVSNSCAPVLLSDQKDRQHIAAVNFQRMGNAWEPIHFDFYVDEKHRKIEPDITNTVPCIAFRKDLREALFPEESPNIELLPIFVSA